MVILRATGKVLRALPKTVKDGDVSDTALGDWYVNRIVVDRQPLLLLVSSNSRLALLTYAKEVRKLPERFPSLVAERLRRLGVPRAVIDAELDVMGSVKVGATKDRSVTGQMVDFAKAIPYYLPINGWDSEMLKEAEDKLSVTPCLSSKSFESTIFPDRKTAELLQLREVWKVPSGCS